MARNISNQFLYERSLDGSVAVITGGAGGLGKAFADVLLGAGCRVALFDGPWAKAQGEDLVLQFNRRYGDGAVIFVTVDVTNGQQLQSAFQQVWDHFQHIDIVCNNAGIVGTPDEATEGLEGNWVQQVRVNLDAVILGTQIALSFMRRNSGRRGVIVNVASNAGILPQPLSPVYTASKAGALMFSRAIAAQKLMLGEPISVHCLCPSFTDTKLYQQSVAGIASLKGAFSPALREGEMGSQAAVLTPSQVAEGFLQLCRLSNRTGTVMRVTTQKGIDFKYYGEGQTSKL